MVTQPISSTPTSSNLPSAEPDSLSPPTHSNLLPQEATFYDSQAAIQSESSRMGVPQPIVMQPGTMMQGQMMSNQITPSMSGYVYPSLSPTNPVNANGEPMTMLYFNPQASGYSMNSSGLNRHPSQGYALMYPYVPMAVPPRKNETKKRSGYCC